MARASTFLILATL